MNFLKCSVGVIFALALTACGGGGGSAGATSGESGTPIVIIGSFVYSFDKPSLNNDGTDKVILTVTALDTSRNVMKDVPVAVSVDSGVYTPVVLTTDSSGQVTGNISIGGDKSNRNITTTIRVGSQTTSAVVAVVGSQISLTPLPATPGPGSTAQVILKAIDSNGAGIASADIQLGGSLGFTQLVRTDLSGAAIATLGAVPLSAGTYTISASGLGVNASRDVQVVGSGLGVPDALGAISAASISANPNSVAPNVVGSTSNRSSIRAVFQNATNQAVQNVRVRFEIVDPGLGGGEQLSTGNSILYTDGNGVVSADYIPGTRTSPTDGVRIRACYGNTDVSIAGALCPNSVIATLTVAGQPLSITLGDNNLLTKGSESLTYIKKFDVAVADAAGNAVSGAVVSATVDITQYGKGLYTASRLFCNNEDANRNGFLDSGEDLDSNGILFPRKADVILSFSGSNVTSANGRIIIQAEYPQNVATWLRYTVRVTTNVAGSEGTAAKSYVTSFIEGDDTNGSFLTPPFGVNACNAAN